MKSLYQIYTLTLALWLYPPIKQKKSKYFIYFLILPVIEAVNILDHYLHQNFFLVQELLSVISFISVLETKSNKKIQSAVPLILLCCFGLYFGKITNDAIFIFIQVLILGVFVKQFILKLFNEKKINIFMLMLIFYEITIITKTINLLAAFANANFYYIITSIFDIIIGLFFCLYKSDSKSIIININ